MTGKGSGFTRRGLRVTRDLRVVSFCFAAASSDSSRLIFWAWVSRLGFEAGFLVAPFLARFVGCFGPLGLGRVLDLAGSLVAADLAGFFETFLGVALGLLFLAVLEVLVDFLALAFLAFLLPCFLEVEELCDFLRRFADEASFLVIAR